MNHLALRYLVLSAVAALVSYTLAATAPDPTGGSPFSGMGFWHAMASALVGMAAVAAFITAMAQMHED